MPELGKRFEKCQAYISSHLDRAGKGARGAAGVRPAITISRETGAGATTLADALVEYLNQRAPGSEPKWTVFDKNLVEQVLKDHDLPARLARFMPEDKPKHLEDAVGDMLGVHPPNWELVKHTGETIYRLAKMGGCVLIGRGANIITQHLPNVLNLRLIGSLDKRVVRCMTHYGFTEAEARDFIKKQDRARRRYLLAYYDREIDDALNYDLVINVDRFTLRALVELLAETIWNKKTRSPS